MSWVKKFHIPLPGALLALLAFFLPWISVGCAGLFTLEGTGFDLASGSFFEELASLGGNTGGQVDTGIFPILWAIPVVAVVSIALVYLTMRSPASENRTSMGHILLGLVGIGALAAIWYQTRGSGEASEFVEFKYGIWLTLGGLLIMLVGGILSYLEVRQGVEEYHYDEYAPGTVQSVPAYVAPVTPTTSAEAAMPRAFEYGTESPVTSVGVAPGPVNRPTEVLNKPPAALAWLVMKDGPRAGHTFPLSEVTSIGRDAGNDIIIDDTSMSGQHAKVKLEEGGQFILYDLASTNGVFAYDVDKGDWERVYRYDLSDGRQIKLGRTVLHFMHLNEGPSGS